MEHSNYELSFVYVDIAKYRHEDGACAADDAVHREAYVCPEPFEYTDVGDEFIDSDIYVTDGDALSV